MKSLPEGWLFEDDDPSVGIFGKCYYHDGCPNWNPDDDASDPADFEAVEEDIQIESRKWTIVFTTRLTCPSCGEIVYTGPWEEPK